MVKHPKSILHVDDDADDRFLVQHALHTIDPKIVLHQAQNGKEALEFLTQARLTGDFPCVILLDMNMPVMNGMDMYLETRKDPVLLEIPIVIFSTSINSKEVDYWQKENVTMITKPASFNELTERIKTILDYCYV